MKKLAFILLVAFVSSLSVQAIGPAFKTNFSNDQVQYCKVINDTGNAMQYKVGNDTYTIEVGESEPFAFEENAQIMKKDTNGNWVNWFVFSNAYSGQSVQLSTLLAL